MSTRPESLAYNTPGANCQMGQSTATGDGGTDASITSSDLGTVTISPAGPFTQACSVPAAGCFSFK